MTFFVIVQVMRVTCRQWLDKTTICPNNRCAGRKVSVKMLLARCCGSRILHFGSVRGTMWVLMKRQGWNMNLTDMATKFRRDLHRIPELHDDLPLTCAYVKEALAGLPCTVTEPSKSAICAFFDFGRPETVAWRADMDALPVTETCDTPWKSVHEGRMHACGHDGHTAMALALAHWVGHQQYMPRNVLFVFQPAEETTGGARQIVESGVFAERNVTRVFGMHVWPELPFGTIASCPGPMFAKSSEVNVDIEGVSAHIARAREGADALEAGVRFVSEAYGMIAGEVAPEQPKLLKFGMMHSGTVRNALSASTQIRGSLRAFEPDVFEFMKKRLFEIASKVSEETGARVCLTLNEGYPPVLNDPALYEKAVECLEGAMARLPEPAMTAEDFSFYQQAAPGVFMCLGTGGKYPLHSEKFDFDEAALGIGVEAAIKLLCAV